MPVSFADSRKQIVVHVAEEEDDRSVNLRDQPLDARIKAREIEQVSIDQIKPNPRNAKKHPRRQIALLAQNIEHFGFTQPVSIDEKNGILSGHARFEAAQKIGLRHLPVVRLPGLTEAERKALAIADNKLAEHGEWDLEILSQELSQILQSDELSISFDPRSIGFETFELDQLLGDFAPKDRPDPADDIVRTDPEAAAISKTGYIWVCAEHRALCGDARNPKDYAKLMGRDRAQIIVTDPPSAILNVDDTAKFDGMPETELAREEKPDEKYREFLFRFLNATSSHMAAGAIAYLSTDMRRSLPLQLAASSVFGVPKDLIVWVRDSAGTGGFYRSQHGLIWVYAARGAPIKNFGRSKSRYRSNVWKYPGFAGRRDRRDEAGAKHSIGKPVALIMDALMDCSSRGGVVLDPFAGFGTTMIAAERTKRRARLIEIDPLRCDAIVARWQKFTGKAARLAETNETFDEVKSRNGARS